MSLEKVCSMEEGPFYKNCDCRMQPVPELQQCGKRTGWREGNKYLSPSSQSLADASPRPIQSEARKQESLGEVFRKGQGIIKEGRGQRRATST